MSDTSATSSLTKRGPTADRMEENDFKRLKSELDPNVSQHTVTENGSSIKCIPLASHHLAPSKFEDLKFLQRDKQAKELFKKHAAKKANTEIAEIPKRRKENGKEAPSNIVAALGSDEEVYSLFSDCGMFAAVFTAYSYHYKLRTSPDDWWFCVIKRVACAIDEKSQKESVRKMFVEHEGKKDITVEVPDRSIYTVNYSWFFDQITKGIKENVKVPEFVDGMTADFSTTTPVQKIVSQVTLMSSVKQYFGFHMRTMCGIPALEMLGTQADWEKLTSKLKILRTLLEPLENDIGISTEWWDLVQKVFLKLVETYQGKPDQEWWSHIMDYKRPNGSGTVGKISGWITDFMEGTRHRRLTRADDFTSGLVTVPLTIKDLSGAQDTAVLVAGMLGFTVHMTDTSDEVTVQPFQGWSLILGDDSPFVEKHD